MSSKTLLIITRPDGPEVFYWEKLQAQGQTKEGIEAICAAFDPPVTPEFLTIEFNPPTRKKENDVERGCLIPNELLPGSFRLDGSAIPTKRFAAYVKTWTRPDTISEATYEALHPAIADAVAALLQNHLYPNASVDFTLALRGAPSGSEKGAS